MSRNKDGTLYYTRDELQRAVQNSSALEYAKGRYKLIRRGNRYTMEGHDSMVFTLDGKWFWNSHGIHGNALDFMQKFEGKSMVEAVLTLAGTLYDSPDRTGDPSAGLPPPPAPPAAPEPLPFVVPEAAATQKNVFAYLSKTRGLSPTLVRQMLADRMVLQVRQFVGMRICGYAGKEADNAALYVPGNPEEAERLRPYLQERVIVSRDALHPLPTSETVFCMTGKEASQLTQQGILQEKQRLAMFGYDDSGIARYCSIRSMNSQGKGFKMDMPGSDKHWPFLLKGREGASMIIVTESPIEAMSYRELCILTGSPYRDCPILSLGGASVLVGLEQYLTRHPEITELRLGLNRDDDGKHREKAGERATERLKEIYSEKYQISVHVPSENDWNDVLRAYRSLQPPQPQPQLNTSVPQH